VVRAFDALFLRTSEPHGGAQICPQQVCTHVEPGSWLSQSLWPFGQSGVSPQNSTNALQTHPPPLSADDIQHWQLLSSLHAAWSGQDEQVSHTGIWVWAKAGVRMLVRIGAVHATAAPAPIRLSILRREMPSADTSRGSSEVIQVTSLPHSESPILDSASDIGGSSHISLCRSLIVQSA
jgi:hypothetical protein